eukprot:6958037-Prymnesium_polylepis.1
MNCDAPEYSAARNVAFAMIMVWPVGTSVLYSLLLFASREAILTGRRTSLSNAVAFLADDYQAVPHGFMWEVIEMNRKLVLTGVYFIIKHAQFSRCSATHTRRCTVQAGSFYSMRSRGVSSWHFSSASAFLLCTCLSSL